ncbi:S-4TM family putative pore-forming effector [Bacillus cereus]|uniref:Probable CBASS effector molecule IK1_05631 n=1 Tax=Bacillus cereus (strain VD146) TaxID=1053236 RepID=Y5631_BACCX|nr:S-4TM family putative pore-forming effector [Bacillus cereus]R8NBR0.1 RecName: Full=Probable CBASS effector molecule IK1_05631 [Bacillus cereus VD146]EOP43921.1 hypothetical protein IK1_05631 [Bacillus cereus VD146]
MLEKQNSEENIELLRAMRYCYNKSKIFYAVRISISILIPILSISIYLFNRGSTGTSNTGVWFSVIGSIWLLIAYQIEKLEGGYIEKGAKIQEKFDINLFNIRWNNVLVGNQISPEDIRDFSSKFKGDEEKLKNWYGGLSSKHFYVNVILAQRSNLMWAISLKRNFSILLFTVSVLYLFLTIAFGFFVNMSMQEYIIKILLPSMSILIYGFKTSDELKKQSNKLEALGNSIISKFDTGNLSEINASACREYQDAIFVYNRIRSILIPEWLYWLRQQKDDEKMIQINIRLTKKSNLF